MSVNLIEIIQKTMGLPSLQKVNPNTNDINYPEDNSKADKLTQASLPAMLIALYKITRTAEGSNEVLRGNFSTSWIDTLFGRDANRAVGAIADYAHVTTDVARVQMESVAREAVNQVQKHARDAATATSLLTDQRSNTLSYLPAGLHVGDLLNDSTIDDRTSKMREPISNLMHTIEEKFSGSDQSTPSQT